MKKLFTLLLTLCMVVALSPFSLKGQTVNQYSFAASVGTFTAATGATASTATADDATQISIAVPFTFNYNGSNFTAVGLTANGALVMGTGAAPPTANTFGTAANYIAPFWDDNNPTNGGSIKYVTTGTTPNRVFTVEWNVHMGSTGSSTAPLGSFQVKLFETTNVVQLVYGTMNTTTGASATIGILGSGTTNFISVTPTVGGTATSSTITAANALNANSANLVSGTTYTFTPPPPCTGTPTGGTIAAAAATQSLCTATVPAALTPTGITIATGLTYQWQTATDAAFTTPVNATGTGPTTTSFTPAATPASFTAPIYYRLKVTCTASTLFGYSNVVTINPPANPTIQASAVGQSTFGKTSLTVTSTAGNGNGRLIAINSTNSFTDPVNGSITPTTSLAYTSGQLNFYTTGTTAAFTGLTASTTYYVKVYEYQRCGSAAPYTYNFNSTATAVAVNTSGSLSYDVVRSTNATFTSIANTGSNFSWTGTSGLGDDFTTNPLVLPSGFAFTYAGVPVTKLTACTNGWLSLAASTSTAFATGALGSSNPGFVIAPMFEDLVCAGYNTSGSIDPIIYNQANGNGIRYQIDGSAPNRILTVEWTGMEIYANAGPNLNFQVKLYETTNAIDIVYGTMEGFNGSLQYIYTYSMGLTAGVTTVAAGDVFVLQNANTDNFSEAGVSSTTAGTSGSLNRVADCNTKYAFTTGTYHGLTAVSTAAPANDEPAGAVVVTPGTTACTSFCGTYYTTKNATASAAAAACLGTADDDVWFKFTATAADTKVDIGAGGSFIPRVQILNSDYSVLSTAICVTAATGLKASANPTALVVGNDYFVRVYHDGAGSSSTTGIDGMFSICVYATPQPPANDNCTAATILPINATCVTLAGSTLNSTASTQAVCAGTADDDVWYKFVANTGENVTINVQSVGSFNAHVQVLDGGLTGDCAATTSVSCINATSTGGLETVVLSSLTSGKTYFVRVYHTLAGTASGSFTICATATCRTPTPSAATSILSTSANIPFTCTDCSGLILEYGPTASFTTPGVGATAGTGGTVVPITTSPFALTGLTAVTGYRYFLRQSCTVAGYSANSAALTFTTPEACPVPTAVATNTIRPTSANVTWTCATCGTDPVIIEYGPVGFVPGTGATAGAGTIASTTVGSPYVLTGLTNGTAYDLYVRRDCSGLSNGFSALSPVVTFTTPTACIAPTDQATSFVSSAIGATTFTGTFTAAATAPTGYLVVRYPTGVAATAPVDGTTYTTGSVLGGTFVANLTSPTVTFNQTGLTASTTYDYYVYTYTTGTCFGPIYNTVAPLTGMVTTCPSIVAPGTPTSSLVTANSFTASWTASSTPSATYLLDIATNSTFTTFLAGYNAKSLTGLSETVTGLNSGTTFYVRVRAELSPCASLNTSTLTVATTPITSVATGDWSDPATWGGTVPSCTDGVTIGGGFTVTVNSATNVCRSATVATGSTLVVSSGDLTVGCTLNNNTLTVNGTLTVSGGVMNHNGNINIASATAAFTQSGGTIKIDGNAASVVGSSVASGTPLFKSISNIVNLTGGTLVFVDPHAATSASSGLTLSFDNGTAVTNTLTTSAMHTTQFGDGVSTDAGGHTSGFYIDNWVTTAYLALGNVIINGGTGTNRNVTSAYQLTANGDFTVNALSNLTTGFVVVGGNLTISSTGTFTNVTGNATAVGISAAIVASNTGSGLTFGPSTTAQTITNNGTLTNFATASTANIGSFTVNNSNAAGVTLASPLTMSGSLSFLAGKLVLGPNNLTLITGGLISGTSATAYVVTNGAGALKQTPTAATAKLFPVGSSISSYDPITITPATGVPFAVTVKASITNPVTTTNSAGTADPTKFVQREWNITPTGTPGATDLTFKPDAAALTTANTPTTAGSIGHWNGTAYDAPITATFATATGWTVAGYTGTFSPFIVAAPDAVLAVEFTTINAQAKGSVNEVTFTTATEKDVKAFSIERSINNKTWDVIGTKVATGGSSPAAYSFTDNQPAALSYYRVRSFETSGKGQLSKVVAVKRNGGKLAVIAVSPMPTFDEVNVDFSIGKSSKVTVMVMDIVGKVVRTETFKTTEGANAIRLDLSNLAQGTYIMTLNDGETMASQRIVKQ
jgi:hypothetical protein